MRIRHDLSRKSSPKLDHTAYRMLLITTRQILETPSIMVPDASHATSFYTQK